ncbi:MAG: hypothetical protein ACYCZF_04370 [Anaerolineae bacterium]
MDELAEVLAKITPQRVREIVYMVAQRPDGSLRPLVAVESIASAIVGTADLGDGQTRGRAFEQLRLLIREIVGQVPDLKYIAGSP